MDSELPKLAASKHTISMLIRNGNLVPITKRQYFRVFEKLETQTRMHQALPSCVFLTVLFHIKHGNSLFNSSALSPRAESARPALNWDLKSCDVVVDKCWDREALRDALRCAKQKGFLQICVEGDSKLVIDAVYNLWSVSWRFKTDNWRHSMVSLLFPLYQKEAYLQASKRPSRRYCECGPFGIDVPPQLLLMPFLFVYTESGCTKSFSF